MRPTIPAADSRWPTFDFTAPTTQGPLPFRAAPTTLPSARASMGSPTAVPVPCASMYPMSAGATPASRQASAIIRAWASSLGTEMPVVRPSWFVALPRSTA
ncbi:MAG: hypothetical protein AUG49_07120 [Catenulispora sp. 13_1_20CM_3_70_7]|nr:MAG: hypothetical protein AUG49_07120 [Catenulispora sp. 13_1_20CM_3_70_7]